MFDIPWSTPSREFVWNLDPEELVRNFDNSAKEIIFSSLKAELVNTFRVGSLFSEFFKIVPVTITSSTSSEKEKGSIKNAINNK